MENREIPPSSTPRNTTMEPCGYCKPFFSVVISKALLEIRKVPSFTSSTPINSAMEAWGLCKPLLCSSCCTISATSVTHASFVVIFSAETITIMGTGGSALNVESDSYRVKNGVLGLVTEHSLSGRTRKCCVNCATDDILPIANVSAIDNPLAITFIENICSAFMLILEAPWFYFVILLWLL